LLRHFELNPQHPASIARSSSTWSSSGRRPPTARAASLSTAERKAIRFFLPIRFGEDTHRLRFLSPYKTVASAPRLTALFEPLQNSGIGATFVYELSVAGVVAIDDIRGYQRSSEGFLDFESLRRRWPRVGDSKRIRADYGRTVDSERATAHTKECRSGATCGDRMSHRTTSAHGRRVYLAKEQRRPIPTFGGQGSSEQVAPTRTR